MIRALDALIRREIERHQAGTNEFAEAAAQVQQPMESSGIFADPAPSQENLAGLDDPMQE